MITNKKDDHVKLAQKFYTEKNNSDFENLKFIHHSFPEIDVEDIDIKTEITGFKINQPFFINAMTGGSDKTKLVNEKLAIVARETGLVMASGSLSAAVKDKKLVDSFKIIRETNPEGIIFANLGPEHSVKNAKKAIEILDADAIQIHVNSLQELVMPEGDRNFRAWLKNIENIVSGIEKPVIVKEVGVGMSSKTIEQLINIGVKNIDISGSGGTNFSKIENYRRKGIKYDYLENFGQSTAASLLESKRYMSEVQIIASGGVTNPMDIVKCLSLGATAVGMSSFVLNTVLDLGVDKTIEILNNWKYEIKVIMTLLGAKNISKLKESDILILGELKDFAILRNINIKEYANRSKK